MVWLKDITIEGNLARSPWDYGKNGTITDFRRGSGDNNTFPAIEYGDVYELVTADEVICPLLNIYFLRLSGERKRRLYARVRRWRRKDKAARISLLQPILPIHPSSRSRMAMAMKSRNENRRYVFVCRKESRR
ncbi:hypothetical protein B0T24DRAFT_333947 [Lasiosphaeria ovina]|uniref:Uncharacterized protein n=1 Tax=Lasiosphaeria ovina TaxID=92902 RepID=A0AAE0N684_9PEZI|nr:hypothetical protein B0T24DRAFT_333947 [Lasiosphaeria ovina]